MLDSDNPSRDEILELVRRRLSNRDRGPLAYPREHSEVPPLEYSFKITCNNRRELTELRRKSMENAVE